MRIWPWLLLLLAPGCPGKERVAPTSRPAWPPLPTTSGSAARLVKARTRRPIASFALPTDADEVLERLRQGPIAAGWPAIVRVLQGELERAGRSVLLVGTYHDAGGQVRAFRRLVGPGGLRGLRAAAVELLPADGRWDRAPAEQRGLGGLVARYLASGDRDVLQAVRRAVPGASYTAWKYRYVDEVIDLLVGARAAGLALLPCDMPRALQRRTAADQVDRLRELHCLLSLDDALGPGPRRVAMLWGQAHLAPGALPRFLRPRTRVVRVYLFGHRPGPAGIELGLRGRLHLLDPLLLPLAGQATYALLLDGPTLGGRLLRARDVLARPLPPGRRHRLEVTLDEPGMMVVAGRRVALEAGGTALPLAPGTHAFLLESAGKLLAGALRMPRRGALALTAHPREGRAELTVQSGPPGE